MMRFNIRSLTTQQVFLIDGIGAMLSAVLLWVIYSCKSIFTIPESMFLLLIFFPVLFACYSLGCAWVRPVKWKLFLSIVMTGNLLYIFYSLCLAILYFEELNIPGLIYFLSETFVILAVVYFEYLMMRER